MKGIVRRVAARTCKLALSVSVVAFSVTAGGALTPVPQMNQTPSSSATGTNSAHLSNGYRWVYFPVSKDSSRCVNSAERALASRSRAPIKKSDTGLTLYANDGGNQVMIACRSDHGVAIISVVGSADWHSLKAIADDLKNRMDAEVKIAK